MDRYTCAKCGTTDVEICFPAWFNPNNNFSYVEPDLEAEPLSCFCNAGCDSVPLKHGSDDLAGSSDTVTGRWD